MIDRQASQLMNAASPSAPAAQLSTVLLELDLSINVATIGDRFASHRELPWTSRTRPPQA